MTHLIQILQRKFGPVKRGNGDWVRIRCPTCNPHDARKMKRGINLKSLSTNCFICKTPLDIQTLLANENFVASTTRSVEESPDHPQAKTWPCKAYIPINAMPADSDAVRFLAADHLHDLDEIYQKYEVGYIPREDQEMILFERSDGSSGTAIPTGDSLVFPVKFKGEFVGWQTRFLNPRNKKFKYLHVFKKGKYLYNYDRAKEYELVVVVEGVKKSWKFDNAVATFGTGISPQQLQLIQEWENIVFLYDGEDHTQKSIRELAEIVGRNRKCITIDPRDYGYSSPDDMTPEIAKLIVANAWQEAENLF